MYPTRAEKILNDTGYDAKTIISEWIITDSNKTRKTERLFLGGTKKMFVIDLTKIIEFV